MQIVRCNACGGWIGDQVELEIKSDESSVLSAKMQRHLWM